MEKPDLNRMWDTSIKVPKGENIRKSYELLYNDIRFKVQPVISTLIKNNLINWYHFLLHTRETSAPAPEGDKDLRYHIRFSLKDSANPEDINNLLPEYCFKPIRHIEPSKLGLEIDINKIKKEELAEVWRIIGEQCEWLLKMLDIHKEDTNVPIETIIQFLHYFENMTRLVVPSLLLVK